MIAIPKEGLVSARNKFISKNFGFTEAQNGVATINISEMQLTAGSITIPAVTAERVDGTSIDAALSGSAAAAVNRVVYVAYVREWDGTLSLLDSTVISAPGTDGTFPTSLAYSDREVVVFAYGIIDANAQATAKYADYQVRSGEDIAYLIAHRNLSTEDYLFTKTTGVLLQADINAAFSTVEVASVNIATSGSTSVPYANSVQVNISATDADGLAVLVTTGLGTPYVRPLQNGSISFSINNLGGGEQFNFYLGEYDGENFTSYKQYGGVAVIAAQGATFDSVSVNGTSVSASGTTQVVQEANTVVEVAASNVQMLNMRVLVNGTPRTMVPKINNVFTDEIANLQVGDVLTFQLGHIINDAFVVAASYGGTATIAVNPPAFSSLSIGGNAIPSSGNTNVVEDTGIAIAVTATNANGKMVAVSVNGDAYQSIGQISNGSFNGTINVVAGEHYYFAIGESAGGQHITVDTTYGGHITGIAQPVEGISEVTINTVPLTSNLQDQVSGSKALAIAVTGIDTTNKRACAYAGDVAIGGTFTLTSGNAMTFNNDVASMANFYFDTSKNYYFYVGTYNGNTFTVTHKFQYYYNTAGSDES